MHVKGKIIDETLCLTSLTTEHPSLDLLLRHPQQPGVTVLGGQVLHPGWASNPSLLDANTNVSITGTDSRCQRDPRMCAKGITGLLFMC